MAGKVYKGDHGVVIRVDTGIDLTSVTTPTFSIKKPNGALVTWNASVESPPTAGFLTYTTAAGDLDSAGNYFLQVVTHFGANKFTGETAQFRIYDLFT